MNGEESLLKFIIKKVRLHVFRLSANKQPSEIYVMNEGPNPNPFLTML